MGMEMYNKIISEVEEEDDDNLVKLDGKRESEWATLPLELQSDILAKLPSKALVRCQSVSKVWQGVIRSQDFRKIYSSQIQKDKMNSSTKVLLVRAAPLDVLVFDFLRLEVVKKLVHDHPRRHILEPIASCKGMLCLMNCFSSQIWAYTLETGSVRIIDTPENTFHYDFFGFGYDSLSQDYKVLSMPRTTERQPMLFSFNTNSWKLVQPCPFDHYHHRKRVWDSMVAYNNVLHWAPFVDVRACASVIFCFDLTNENYFQLPKPVSCAIWSLVVVRGLLHFVHYTVVPVPDRRVDVWVMQVYGVKESWTKLFQVTHKQILDTVPFGLDCFSMSCSKPYVCSEDGMKFILGVGKPVVYFLIWDLSTQQLSYIHNYCPFPAGWYHKYVGLPWMTA